MENAKNVLASKTWWAALAAVFLPFLPAVGQFIEEHPEACVQVSGLIFMLLRFLTKKPLTVGPPNNGEQKQS